jgi:hypothetical protein
LSRLVIKPVVLGKRIELIRTDNPYADLKPGDRGTVVDVSELSYEDKPLKYILDPQYADIKARMQHFSKMPPESFNKHRFKYLH